VTHGRSAKNVTLSTEYNLASRARQEVFAEKRRFAAAYDNSRTPFGPVFSTSRKSNGGFAMPLDIGRKRLHLREDEA
jgi:hypothetical protein